MTDPAPVPEPPAAGDEASAPRADLKDALAWMALGVAVLIGSITMDRLKQQHINPVTVPGLLPGLLGIAMILLGGTLAVRSLRHGALHAPLPPVTGHQRAQRMRVAIAIALCTGYGVVLVGHGIPFWLASSIYIASSILVFRRLSVEPTERRLGVRAWINAIVIGVGASAMTWLVFEKLFLVRLP